MSECPHYNNYNNWCEKSNKEIDWSYAKYNCCDNYFNCPTYRNNNYQGENGSSSGGCYLTTAMCQILNKPDNCEELEILREFRDNYLLKNDDTQKLVYEYYRNSPPLSNKLKESTNKNDIAEIMLANYIKPIICKIKELDYNLAIETYKNMYTYLTEIL